MHNNLTILDKSYSGTEVLVKNYKGRRELFLKTIDKYNRLFYRFHLLDIQIIK